MEFSRDVRYLASGCLQTVTVWDVATADIVRTQGVPVRRGKEPAFWPDLTELTASVTSIAFSRDGHYLACGRRWARSSDPSVVLWDVATWNVARTLQDSFFNAESIAFSPDGRYLAIGGDQATSALDSPVGVVKLWEVATGTMLRTLPAEDYVTSVAFSPDGRYIVSGGGDGDYKRASLKLWDAGTGGLIYNLSGHTSMVKSVVFSSDGHWIASGSHDQTIRLWDTEKGIQAYSPIAYAAEVTSVALSPRGQYLVSASSDYKVNIWDARNRTLVRTLPGSAYSGVALSNDGKYFALLPHEGLSVALWH